MKILGERLGKTGSHPVFFLILTGPFANPHDTFYKRTTATENSVMVQKQPQANVCIFSKKTWIQLFPYLQDNNPKMICLIISLSFIGIFNFLVCIKIFQHLDLLWTRAILKSKISPF